MENATEEKRDLLPGDKLTSDKMKNTGMMRLILQMSVPAIVSMLVLSLYNIVDSIFISRYDAKALDALSIAFPMQQMMIAFAIGIAIGLIWYFRTHKRNGNTAGKEIIQESSSTVDGAAVETEVIEAPVYRNFDA